MSKLKTLANNTSIISIYNLKKDEIDDYLKIEFDAFYEKLKFVFSNNKKSAYNIIKSEIYSNFGTNRYFNAKIENKIVGIIELVTKETVQKYKRSITNYFNNLGFFRGLKAYFLTFLDIPRIDNKTMYIDNLAVDINSRRKGIAKKMLSFAEEYGKKNKIKSLRLWVARKNNIAYRLYKNFGFNKLVIRSSTIAKRYFGYRDWIYMGKEIS